MEQKNNPKFAFFYLLSLVALLFTSISVGVIVFQLINKFIPDLLNEFNNYVAFGAVNFAISSLIIAVPIYYITTYLIIKSLYKGDLDKDSPIRRWLTYFVLLVTSIVMIFWLISVINNFLGGEFTIKFILKALTAILIAASIFGFYLYDIRRKETLKKEKFFKFYFYGSLSIIIIVFISAFFVAESPLKNRDRKIDQKIINDLGRIDSAIYSFYYDKNALPENLDELKSEIRFISDQSLTNPFTKNNYEYKKISEKKYELCTDFKTSNKEINKSYDYWNEKWMHDSGYQCFSLEVPEKEERGEAKPLPVPEFVN
jgi:hypothetical protein